METGSRREHLLHVQRRQEDWQAYVNRMSVTGLKDIFSTLQNAPRYAEKDLQNLLIRLRSLQVTDDILSANEEQLEVLLQQFLREQAPLVLQTIQQEATDGRVKMLSLLKSKRQH